MTIEEQIQLQNHVRAHQDSLGCFELRRRRRLVREATALIGKLTERVVAFAGADRDQYQRSVEALRRACRRATRREQAYYGA